jgi:phosphopantetheinyl transferase (holo-ACP synthase)
VAKRGDDWLIGRLTAKSVVAEALGDVFPGDWPLRAIEIPSDANGMPYARVAPEFGPAAGFAPGERLPVSVSISHAEGRALCAAAFTEPVDDGSRRALGIDLGMIEPRSPGLVGTFFTEEEQGFVRDAPPSQRDLRANLIWCAKEAVLKALGLGLTVDTRDLCCRLEPGRADPGEWPIAPAGGEWRPFVAACGPALVPGGGAIRGIWRSFPGFVGALASRAGDPGAASAARTRATLPRGGKRTNGAASGTSRASPVTGDSKDLHRRGA